MVLGSPGSEIRDPEKTYSGSRIPDPGVKKHPIPDPGSRIRIRNTATSKGLGYNLHVHTAGGAYCWSRKDTLQVNTVCGGKGYTLHDLTPGGEKGYKFILLAVQEETPCTSILLVLKGGYNLHIHTAGCRKGYTLHVHTVCG